MTPMETTEWLANLGDYTTREVARKASISERTLQHQVNVGKISMDNVARIADAYSIHPLRALIDTGFIDSTWAQVPDVAAALRIATDEQLTDEILRRLTLVAAAGERPPAVYTTPVDRLAEMRQKRNQPAMSELPDNVAADTSDEKGIPDIPSEAEESQDTGEEDFDPA